MADITLTKRRIRKKYGAVTNFYSTGSGGGVGTETDPVFTAWDKDYNDLINKPTIVTDHGGLTGLADDDHSQYHNDTRGDARYYTKTNLQTSGQSSVHWNNLTNKPTLVTDHGDLTGLADDDHTQYHNDARANTWLATKSLDALSDVAITSPANNSYLKYDGANWIDEAPVTITPSAEELNYVDGVTSPIQTQLNGKEAALGNPSTNGYILSSTTAGVRSWIAPPTGGSSTLDGLTDVEITTPSTNATLKYDGTKWVDEPSVALTITEAELNALHGITATAAEINTLDGITATTAELNYCDGVTSNIQTQLNAKSNKNATISTKTSAYTVQSSDNNSIIECNGTFQITLPNSLDTGFQVTIVNVGTGVITLAASTTLYSKSSNRKLASQYVGATAYHRGSNVWIAMGDLTA